MKKVDTACNEDNLMKGERLHRVAPRQAQPYAELLIWWSGPHSLIMRRYLLIIKQLAPTIVHPLFRLGSTITHILWTSHLAHRYGFPYRIYDMPSLDASLEVTVAGLGQETYTSAYKLHCSTKRRQSLKFMGHKCVPTNSR